MYFPVTKIFSGKYLRSRRCILSNMYEEPNYMNAKPSHER